uniref:Uncharacterized protein n=1 Tax=Lactuca sativa TaxID=4236 RepID=A0A9R1VNB7_LACSA|nr:hypothetical protein LSAT_V11C400169960 [Lactuca sativa]
MTGFPLFTVEVDRGFLFASLIPPFVSQFQNVEFVFVGAVITCYGKDREENFFYQIIFILILSGDPEIAKYFHFLFQCSCSCPAALILLQLAWCFNFILKKLPIKSLYIQKTSVLH